MSVFTAMAASAHAAVILSTASFDATPDATLTAPFVGTATFTYEAPARLPDGAYNLLSLTSPTFNSSILGSTFTLADLLTPAANVVVNFVGSEFFFSDGGGGPFSGSADFDNGTAGLSTEPIPTGSTTTPLYFIFSNGPPGFGNYGVTGAPASPVPEPTSLIGLAGVIGLAISSRRRRR